MIRKQILMILSRTPENEAITDPDRVTTACWAKGD
jgi:hypothetical protein